jgi:FkbM family methyltransferase
VAELAAVLLELDRFADLRSLLAALVPDSDELAAFAAAIALKAEPTAEQLALLADLREREGRLKQALAAVEQAALLAPTVSGYAQRREELRSRLGEAGASFGDAAGAEAAAGLLTENGPRSSTTTSSPGVRAEVRFENLAVTLLVRNPLDIIQWRHLHGEFYEINQLLFHRNMIYEGSSVLDVGANIGNHTVFYAIWTRARRVYCFEPNPAARTILLDNVRTNRLEDRVDSRYAEYAVGQEDTVAFIRHEDRNNLGATSLSLVSSEPEIARRAVCRRLDGLVFEGKISFMKIDVEGWEMMVLAGAMELIRAHRPTISIEISEPKTKEFWEWSDKNKYHVINAFSDTAGGQTYVMVPRF